MLEPQVLGHVNMLVKAEWKCFGPVEYFAFRHDNLYSTGFQVRIQGSFGTRSNAALDGYYKFISHRFGLFVGLGTLFRIENNLSQSIPVPHIDKNQPAMVTATHH